MNNILHLCYIIFSICDMRIKIIKNSQTLTTAFKGKRQEPLSGTFYYTPFDGALRLTEMLPE